MKTQILDCGHPPSPHSDSMAGYGEKVDGTRHCYECCAKYDEEDMEKSGRAVLYYTGKEVTNWPGSLRFPVYYSRQGRHNIAGIRFDFWFIAFGHIWHGIQYGSQTQIAHCKRTKEKAD